MATSNDKSSNVGYDAQDALLQATLEEWAMKNPKLYRNLTNRVHDGIIQRLREQATRKCVDFAKVFEKCVNAHFGREQLCYPHKDALNACVSEVNTEENYQKYRLAFMTGELKRMHDERLVARVDSFKYQAPEALPNWKIDYTDRFYEAAKNIDVHGEGVGTDEYHSRTRGRVGEGVEVRDSPRDAPEYVPVKQGGAAIW
jgi:COX assembly protein 1